MLEYLANFNTDGSKAFSLIEQQIPQGYRPITTVYMNFTQVIGGAIAGTGRLALNPNGTSAMVLSETSYTEHGGTIIYFTTDPFPIS